jgi:hypothetical protein
MTLLNMPATPSGIQAPGADSPWNPPTGGANPGAPPQSIQLPVTFEEPPSLPSRNRGWLWGLLIIVMATAFGVWLGGWLRSMESATAALPLPIVGSPVAALPPVPPAPTIDPVPNPVPSPPQPVPAPDPRGKLRRR